jgi:hypothetical protein
MSKNDKNEEKRSRIKKAEIRYALNRVILATEDYHRARQALLTSDVWDADGAVNRAVETSTALDEAVRSALLAGATVQDVISNVADLPNWLRDELMRAVDDYFWRPKRKLPWQPDSY